MLTAALLAAFVFAADPEPVKVAPPLQMCQCDFGDQWDGVCCPPLEPKDEVREEKIDE